MNFSSRIFVSWVGLRGAVPIIFATYPVVANIPDSNQIFNIVFFITILSLVIQGTTISWMAKLLHLATPLEKTGNDFGVEIPEEINTDLRDIILTEEMLAKGNRLMDMNLPKGTLVMLINTIDKAMTPYSWGNKSLARIIDMIKLTDWDAILSPKRQKKPPTVFFFKSFSIMQSL